MATPIHIQPMPEFNPDAEIGASLATRWRTWITDLEMYLLASGIMSQSIPTGYIPRATPGDSLKKIARGVGI